jgi:hypothetical protein
MGKYLFFVGVTVLAAENGLIPVHRGPRLSHDSHSRDTIQMMFVRLLRFEIGRC